MMARLHQILHQLVRLPEILLRRHRLSPVPLEALCDVNNGIDTLITRETFRSGRI